MPPVHRACRVRGLLVTCEGIDGSGKSTAARSIVDELKAGGRDARLHVEPTRSWLGEAVRRGFKEDIAPWTEALLFMADHATHVRDAQRELARGAIVVSDRWSDSTFAYQGAVLGDMDLLRRMEKPFDLTPDITLLFDLEPRVALERVGQRGQDQEKFEHLEFLTKVRANYLRLAKDEPGRFVVIDAARPADAVLADAMRALTPRL